MERKIGEIFEYNGEWYQCVGGTCRNCSFYYDTVCKNFITIGSTIIGNCDCTLRTDHKCVIFNKLEKVGEPFSDKYFGLVQKYELEMYSYSTKDKRVCFADGYDVFIKIKQTKEDMEDLDKIKVRDYTKVEELNVMEEKKLNLKPFDIQKAREGKPVCTRDGRKTRILCYDFKQNEEYPILVAVENKDGKECALLYSNDGISEMYKSSNNELAMLPEKKEGWVNVYKKEQNRYVKGIFPSREIALNSISEKSREYIATIKINWSE